MEKRDENRERNPLSLLMFCLYSRSQCLCVKKIMNQISSFYCFDMEFSAFAIMIRMENVEWLMSLYVLLHWFHKIVLFSIRARKKSILFLFHSVLWMIIWLIGSFARNFLSILLFLLFVFGRFLFCSNKATLKILRWNSLYPVSGFYDYSMIPD